MLELANKALFFVVPFSQPPTARLHPKHPNLTFGSTRGNELVGRMSSKTDQRIASAIDVVDQMSGGYINQLRGFIATDRRQPRSIVIEGSSEHPVQMVVAPHDFISICDVEHPNQLIGTPDGNLAIVARDRDTVKRIFRAFDRTYQLAFGNVPNLHFAELRGRAATGHQQRPVVRKGDRFQTRRIARQPRRNGRAVGMVQQYFVMARDRQPTSIGRKSQRMHRRQ